MREPLIYDRHIGDQKPETLFHKNACPFCNYHDTENIIKTRSDMIWTRNKYPTLLDSGQTVLIETADHEANMSNYAPEKQVEVFQFAWECWQEMKNSGKYRSVLVYKNQGPLSGGSIEHAHLQLVGLTKRDGYEYWTPETLQGMSVLEKGKLAVNLSKYPNVGLMEFNVLGADQTAETIREVALMTQNVIQYLMSQHHMYSYNLFFFDREDGLQVHIVPRFIVSPYLVGYDLAQLFTEDVLEEYRTAFLAYLKHPTPIDPEKKDGWF